VAAGILAAWLHLIGAAAADWGAMVDDWDVVRRAGRGLSLALAGPLLLAAACAQRAAPSAVLDSGKVGSVAVGRSSRADVFAALGQPSRTERSAGGEAWIYEARTGNAGGRGWMNGVSAASGVAGAFVPYAGLLGSGLGLAGVGTDAMRADPQAVSLAVTFREDGVVRDCTYSSTAMPAGVPGPATGTAAPIDCQRPIVPNPAPTAPVGVKRR